MRKLIRSPAAVLAVMLLAVCAFGKSSVNYMVLVNKNHELPADWETSIETVRTVNSLSDDVAAEVKAYGAYLRLKDDLAVNDGIHIEYTLSWTRPSAV
ncbi:MAG: hypothetical protein IJG37_11315 [Synergistaceae bacterium]|nr:hypothetical protein [Synergistaceae bacterium]MBQ7169467.1 hypothetical protein [Synergistaceae bacterium]